VIVAGQIGIVAAGEVVVEGRRVVGAVVGKAVPGQSACVAPEPVRQVEVGHGGIVEVVQLDMKTAARMGVGRTKVVGYETWRGCSAWVGMGVLDATHTLSREIVLVIYQYL
jgi:hypothetical protein